MFVVLTTKSDKLFISINIWFNLFESLNDIFLCNLFIIDMLFVRETSLI